ncbi:MAG: proline racemase family protein [Synergistaceae bacterium]|nr:proline racemase family protein [Synergistaceae bacterium]
MIRFRQFITVVDAHTAGEPIRVVTSGLPAIKGGTMLERYGWFEKNLDGVRNLIMREPRGHRDMFGCIVTPPASEDGDFGVLFTHTTGQATMCGHGTIGVVKVVLETGMVPAAEGKNTVRVDTPAGRVTAEALVEDGYVKEVSFRNVPSFLYQDNVKAFVPGIGEIEFAISYGGDFYLFVEAEKLGVEIRPENAGELARKAMALKNWGSENLQLVHPEYPQINELYGTIVTGRTERTEKGWRSQEVCVFADGAVDRSPCGTGTSARMALLYGRGLMNPAEELDNGSIIGTRFRGTIDETVLVGDKRGIIPRITGSAWITGFNQLVLDPTDPLPEGFLV